MTVASIAFSEPTRTQRAEGTGAAQRSAIGQQLSVAGLTHTYGSTRVLDNISFEVPAGELAALLGPSGCGKTTILKLIAGLIRPSRGTIALGSADLQAMPLRARGIGMVFQSLALFPHMTAAENIGYALACRGIARVRRFERVGTLLDLMRLGGLGARFPYQLSAGQQQRIALARALAAEPALLLLDEPFGSLDRHLRTEMQAELIRVQRTLGVTTLLVTHDQDEAQAVGNILIVMNGGRIEQIGTASDLYDRPRTLFVNGFLGQSSRVTGVLRANGPAGVTVALACGTELILPGEMPARPGARVVIVARPEDISVSDEPRSGWLPVRHERSTVSGPNVLRHLALADGTEILALERRDGACRRFLSGERLYAGFNLSCCHIFEAPA